MNKRVIPNNKVIDVAVPMAAIMDPKLMWYELANMLLKKGVPSENAIFSYPENIEVPETECKEVFINVMEDNFFHAILVEMILGHQGFEINWQGWANEPWMEIPLERLEVIQVPETESVTDELTGEVTETETGIMNDVTLYPNSATIVNETHAFFPIRNYNEAGARIPDFADRLQILEAFNKYARLEPDFSNIEQCLAMMHSEPKVITEIKKKYPQPEII